MPQRARGRGARAFRALAAAAIVATFAPVITGCGSSGSDTGGAGRSSGFLRFGDALSNIDSTNPFVATNVFAKAAFTQVYPLLVQYDDDSQIVGDFAKSWQFSEDGRTLTMKTAAGAKWSDGSPLTTHDAAWTLNTVVKYKKGPTAALGGGVNGLVNAEAPDATTLVLHYASPAGTALSQLRTIEILPEHIWAPHVGADGKGLQSFRNATPIVSGGPFVWTTYRKDQVALFKRNPSYYGTPAHIDQFGIQHYSSGDALLQALKNGEIDAAMELTGVEAKALKQEQAIRVLSNPGFTWVTLGFNSNPDKTSRRELQNPDVRLAMAHAIDVGALNDTLQLGYATPTATQVPVGSYTDPSLKRPAYDIAAANKLLDHLGYHKGADGIRVADGKPMSYELLVPEGVGSPQRIAQLVTAGLAKIGVKATAKILDGTGFWTAVTGPEYKYTDSELFVDSWSNYPDPNFSLSMMTCAQRGGLNETGYCNPAYDKLFAEQASQIDTAKRKQIVFELERMLYRDRPFSVFYNEAAIEGWRKGWTGYGRIKGSSFTALSKLPLLEVRRAG
jgi:peptide/nickel transport system substrate-binding protein